MNVADRPSPELWVCHLGVVPYLDALAIQDSVRARRQADELPDTLLLLEHPPVYTRGRRSGAGDLPLGEDFYRAKGIDVVDVDRGGQLTYHGPGQLVGYPIMRIDDVHRYLRTIEDAIIAALGEEGIVARSRHDEGIDYTGVWVDAPRGTPPLGAHPERHRQAGERKIASIGVHVSRGVTTHGFAVNVNNDLQPFTWVVACGLPDVSMTSLACEVAGGPAPIPTGCQQPPSCFRKRVAFSFCQAHGRRQRLVSPQRLGIDAANASTRAERAPIKTDQPATVQPRTPAEAVPA
jgi:lipoyl(octanoyl) transferase